MVEIDAAVEYLRARISCDSGDTDVSQYTKFGIQLVYVLPFAFLYFSFLMAIVRRRNHCEIFEDSFFALHLVDGIVTILFLVLDISFTRITTYIRPVCEYFVPLLKDDAYYLTPYFTLYLYAQFAKMLSTLTMSINRYTSVNYPLLHKSLWLQHCSKAIFAILLIPILFVWPVAIAKTSFLPNKGQTIIMYEHHFAWARTSFGRILIGGSTLIFTVFSSVVTTYKLSKLGKHMRKVEISLTVATVFTSFGFALMLVVQIFQLVVPLDSFVEDPWMATFLLGATQFVNDFYMLSGPIVLIILDKKIRRSILYCSLRRTNSDKRIIEVSARAVTITETHMF
ncbi:Protein CBR-SRG-27 [Caenorhabditis briggsae]|uniref:Serpentine receptor class gamma n=1 Tax=Caenorhabditis briggsae TaxID=6238 RepID=A8X308_CAEBR|nr:Protein CBR-SRG-27 [Caenorhabditis briggsae]CAP27018.1 Protein CBR-SRG-27 [Caenorhabditis briggsae]